MLPSRAVFAASQAFPFEQMSSPATKGLRRSASGGRKAGSKTSVKRRAVAPKAVKAKAQRAVAAKPLKSARRASSAGGKTAKKAAKATAKTSRKAAPAKSKTGRKATPRKATGRRAEVTRQKKAVAPRVKKTQKLAAVRAPRPLTVAQPAPRQPTVDESAALRAFENAHKEFTRGRFAEARNQFRSLLDKYSQVSEVAARSRTYLAIAESRLRTESMLPRDADSLYDRGVIELNRGEYVAAQEMFERALKREPEAAHIHYGLAATRARLGSVDLALQSLQRALDLQPNLRLRAQHDQDLTSLRNDPDFDRIVFQPRL